MAKSKSDYLTMYKASDFVVFVRDQSLLFNIGKRHPHLTRLLKSRAGVLLTAWNPYSKPTPKGRNREANLKLARDLRRVCDEVWCAQGREKDFSFFEDSYVGIGLTKEEAIALGRKYRQNAIVFMDPKPELIWTAD